jgi:hypothetical protein
VKSRMVIGGGTDAASCDGAEDRMTQGVRR